MKRFWRSGQIILAVTSMMLFVPGRVRAEADGFAQLGFTGLSITPVAGIVAVTNVQGAVSGSAGANADAQSGAAPAVNVMGIYSIAQASSTTAGTTVLNVSGQTYSSVQLPMSAIATDAAFTRAAINGQFMITGGTGQVDTTFVIPFSGFLLGYTDAFGQSASSETLLRFSVDGNVILTDDRTSAIAANGHDSQTFLTSLEGDMMLNYNELYTFRLEADGSAMTVNVPEPGTMSILVGGLGLIWCAARKRNFKIALFNRLLKNPQNI